MNIILILCSITCTCNNLYIDMFAYGKVNIYIYNILKYRENIYQWYSIVIVNQVMNYNMSNVYVVLVINNNYYCFQSDYISLLYQTVQ